MCQVADEITLSLLVQIEARGGRYRSFCPTIEVASAGRSIDEALTNIHTAVEERLEHWVEDGRLLAELERYQVPFVPGRRSDLPAHADLPPGVLAMTLNESVRLA
jgi:predicted RNase H-like HicB family nuclease